MEIAGLGFAGIAALVHVYVFSWSRSRGPASAHARILGTGTVNEAAAQRELAFNQGFYNLFLAIVVFTGLVVYLLGHAEVGATLVFAGAGSMVAAATVLILSSPDKAAAALKQGVIPLVGLVLLATSLAR